MRRFALLIPFLMACGGSETKSADSVAAATTAVGPTALTEADVAGTWTGIAMLEGSDSVIGHWTQICGAGSCKGIFEGMKDTVPATYRVDADSMFGSSSAYIDPTMGGAKVTDNWVGRLSGGKLSGVSIVRLADKPDSVVARVRFEGTKGPM